VLISDARIPKAPFAITAHAESTIFKLETLMKRRSLVLASPALLAAPALSWAQAAYPSKPIRYIVPVSAGGGSDSAGAFEELVMGYEHLLEGDESRGLSLQLLDRFLLLLSTAHNHPVAIECAAVAADTRAATDTSVTAGRISTLGATCSAGTRRTAETATAAIPRRAGRSTASPTRAAARLDDRLDLERL
jgi:hypothetical protein